MILKQNFYVINNYSITAAGRPKKSKKESSEDEKDDSDEDEPLNKKGKASFPTVNIQNKFVNLMIQFSSSLDKGATVLRDSHYIHMLRTKCCTSILQFLPQPGSMQYNCFRGTSLSKYIVKYILPIGEQRLTHLFRPLSGQI